MKTNKPSLLILAAGLGSRYGSLKQIDRIGPSGERIIDYSVYDAIRSGFGKIVYVIRKSFEEEFNKYILNDLPKNIDVEYVFQEIDNSQINTNTNQRTKPFGTGHAVLCSADQIDTPFAVINADDFYGPQSFLLARKYLDSVDVSYSNFGLIGYPIKNTLSQFGSVSRGICDFNGHNLLTSIIERTHIKEEYGDIIFKDDKSEWQKLEGTEIVSMNMFLFTPIAFRLLDKYFQEFLISKNYTKESEFYLPSAIHEMIGNNEASVKVIQSGESWFGLTYKSDKPIAEDKIKELVNSGIYPVKLWD